MAEKSTVPRICAECGRSFLARRSSVNRGYGTLCGRACGAKHTGRKLSQKSRTALTSHQPCNLCGAIKPLNEFKKDRNSPNGCAATCLPCHNARAKTYSRRRTWEGDIAVRMTDYVANNYVPVPEAGCWLWLGANSNGYGFLGFPKLIATRLFYHVHKGPIPKGMLVCHKCDTPMCVNPDHLFLGTPADNMHDMIRKGRHPVIRPHHLANKESRK